MKNVILLLLSVCGMLACTHTPKWELVWEDNFDGAEPDTTIWSRIPRGRPDWQNTQSFDNRCYEMRDGCLILKGIVNDNMDVDTAKYLTGGLWTKDKHAFHRGRIEELDCMGREEHGRLYGLCLMKLINMFGLWEER